MLGFFNKEVKQINTFFLKTEKTKLFQKTKKKVLLKITLFKKNLIINGKSNQKFEKQQNKISVSEKKEFFFKQRLIYKIRFNKKKKKTIFLYKTFYIKHFLNLFITRGQRFYVDFLYKNLIFLHKQENSNIIRSIYKLIYLLQFSLLLKGYRYKVGRGVIKYRYFLTPVSILRQMFLSFFYFKTGLKKQKNSVYLNKLLIELYRLIYFEENYGLIIINNLYDLAYQSRMFTPKPKKKRFKPKFKQKNPIIAYYYKNSQNKTFFSKSFSLFLNNKKQKESLITKLKKK
jgi:hypothetical protein